MPKRSQPPSNTAWRDDPAADLLVFQLISLARAGLGEHFSEDTNSEQYQVWLRGGPRGRQPTKPWDLPSLRDSEHGRIRLTALPHANLFTVRLNAASFTAEIAVTYDPEEATVLNARILALHGHTAQATTDAGRWYDSIIDAAFSEMDDEDLDIDAMEIDDLGPTPGMADAGNDDTPPLGDATGAAGDQPPPAGPAAIRRMLGMAERLAEAIAAGDEAHQSIDIDLLGATPQLLWPMLEAIVAACRATARDDVLIAALHLMLAQQLEQIRYRTERGWLWARRMVDEYQDRLLALAGGDGLAQSDLFPLIAALGEARLPVKPELAAAAMEGSPEAALVASMPPEEILATTLRPMIAQMVDNVSSPFELIAATREANSIAPPSVREFLVHEYALSPHAVLRDTVPLMLLDAAAEVRRAAAGALQQIAAPDTLSAVSLRRIIALRNWLPEAERPMLDQVIRKARQAGVETAQWEPAPALLVRASVIDGGGAQSLIITGQGSRSRLLCGVLLKAGDGTRDAWCDRTMSRRDVASALADLQRQVVAPEVERDYVDVVVPHHLAVGLAGGSMAEAALLEVAEAICSSNWRAAALDLVAETASLFAALPEADRSAKAVAAALHRSDTWSRQLQLADSWFEDDPEIHAFVAGQAKQPAAAVSTALLNGPLAERRGRWAEQFGLLALWARAVRPGQKVPRWQDILVLAHELYKGHALADIPVMQMIAGATVAAARSGAW